jgi:hypothetical protein
VTEVSDRGDPESTLGAFDEEGVLTELAEDSAEVSQVVGLGDLL